MKQLTRIIECTRLDGVVEYTIQQPHFLLALPTWLYNKQNKPIPEWFWVDAWINNWNGAACQDTYSTLEIAKENLCYFDGSESSYKVVK